MSNVDALRVALCAAELDFGTRGWHGDERVDPVVYSLVVEENSGYLMPFPVVMPPVLFELAPFHLTLLALARLIASGEEDPAPLGNERWRGLAIAEECWGALLRTEAEARAAAHEGVRNRPDRISTRRVVGILANGVRLDITRVRGDKFMREGNTCGGSKQAAVDDALASLVKAISGALGTARTSNG